MSSDHALLDRLAGTDCPFCEGSVAAGEYRGNAAAICRACGTPTVQLFRDGPLVPSLWEPPVNP